MYLWSLRYDFGSTSVTTPEHNARPPSCPPRMSRKKKWKKGRVEDQLFDDTFQDDCSVADAVAHIRQFPF